MLLCHVSANETILNRETLVTWENTHTDINNHHTKREYLKILQDGKYEIHYEIRWRYSEETTQPLEVSIYRVHKDFMMEPLHKHVTVCVSSPVNVKKKLPFDLKAGERICIGVKNFSTVDFILLNSKLTLSQL